MSHLIIKYTDKTTALPHSKYLVEQFFNLNISSGKTSARIILCTFLYTSET